MRFWERGNGTIGRWLKLTAGLQVSGQAAVFVVSGAGRGAIVMQTKYKYNKSRSDIFNTTKTASRLQWMDGSHLVPSGNNSLFWPLTESQLPCPSHLVVYSSYMEYTIGGPRKDGRHKRGKGSWEIGVKQLYGVSVIRNSFVTKSLWKYSPSHWKAMHASAQMGNKHVGKT